MELPVLNYVRLRLVFCGMFIFAFIFAYIIFPPILKAILKSQVVLKPGTQMRDMYDALPFPLIFKIYVFHVENSDEVQLGGKVKLKEIGPFVFEEWKEKVDQIEDVEMDTIEFTEKKTFIFNRELSSPLTGEEIVTMLNPIMMLIPLVVNVDRAPLLPMIAKSIDFLFNQPKTAFWTGRVLDVLFDGIPIDCTSESFSAKATCSVLRSGVHKAVLPSKEDDRNFKFSFFGWLNGTNGDRFKTYRGIKNIHDLGRIIEFNGKPNIDKWHGEKCNELRGTESSIFPPFKDKKDGIWAFEGFLCRSIQTKYEKPSKYSGLPTSHHIADLGDIQGDEELHCFCKLNGKCPLKGTMDLYNCMNSPLIGSMPHFYNGDPKLFDMIESGLEPDKEKHAVHLDMESISGTPMSASKRLQLNLDLQPIEQIPVMKTMPTMVYPIMWIDESVNLNKTYVNMLKYQLFLGLKFRSITQWMLIMVGFSGAIFSTVAITMVRQKSYNERQKKLKNKIQPTPPNQPSPVMINKDTTSINIVSTDRNTLTNLS